MVVIWSIWKERNTRCFDGITYPMQRLVDKAKFLVASWVLVLPIFRGFSMNLLIFRWREVALEKRE